MIFPPAVRGADAGYQIEKSVRLRSGGNAYVARTPGTSGNRKKWTWVGCIKRGALGSNQTIFCSDEAGFGQQFAQLLFNSSNQLDFLDFSTGVVTRRTTNAVFRDPSGHYQIQLTYDTGNATAADRIRLYVNGTRITSFAASTDPALNYDGYINQGGIQHVMGSILVNATRTNFADMYLSEVHFVDNQALEPSSFGETVSGVWVPKRYTGTYGTTGFYLPFTNGTSLSTLTADASGNGNNWTATNVSLTAGVNYDWMDDTPTNNHATLNNLVAGAANITKANLASGTTAVRATFNALAISSYWEVTAGGSNVTAGIINDTGTTNTVTVTANKVFAFRLSTAGALDYRNVTDAGGWTSITTGLTGNQFPYGTTAAADWNFGQRPFNGTVPGGYAKLCAASIAAGTITTSGAFTGNASTDGPFIFTNGVPTSMTINGNAVTFATHADKTAGGFKVRSSSASYNTAGSNTYSITTTGAAFKNARAQVNP